MDDDKIGAYLLATAVQSILDHRHAPDYPTFTTQWSNSANLVAGVTSEPEIDLASAASGLTLLLGSLMVLRGRRSVKLVSVAA